MEVNQGKMDVWSLRVRPPLVGEQGGSPMLLVSPYLALNPEELSQFRHVAGDR